MSTIKDVARLSGVSPSTVSRVLSGSSPSAASERTKERIWEAVRKTGYSVNETARSLRKNETVRRDAGQAIDCVLARELAFFLDPLLSSIRRVIEEELFKHGYRLRMQCGISDLKKNIKQDEEKKDAAVILGRIDPQSLKMLKSNYRHLIYVGLQDLPLGVDSVICSGYDAMCTAMDYLFSLGHRKICYIGEVKDEQRYSAYLHKLSEFGLSCDKRLTVDVLFTPNDSYEGLKKALAGGLDCTAIVCANDASAVGVLIALREARLSVPKDISIIGINDVEEIRYLDPMLTSISVPVEELGKHTVKLLIDRIEQGHSAPVKLYVPSHLIRRDSTASLD